MKKKTKINFAGFASILLIAGIGLGLVAVPQSPESNPMLSVGQKEGIHIYEINSVNVTLMNQTYPFNEELINMFENVSEGDKRLFNISNIHKGCEGCDISDMAIYSADLIYTDWVSNITIAEKQNTTTGWILDPKSIESLEFSPYGSSFTGIPLSVDTFFSLKDDIESYNESSNTVELSGAYHPLSGDELAVIRLCFNESNGLLENATWNTPQGDTFLSYYRH